MNKAYALLVALAAGGIVGVLRSYGTLAEEFRTTGRPQVWLEKLQRVLFIPEEVNFPQWLNPIPHGQMTGLVFEPSVLLIGAGMITGLRVSLSMLLGSVLLYFVVAPRLLLLDLTHARLAGYVPTFSIEATGDFNPTRWALWGGTSIMVFSSLATVALQWRTLARAFTLFKKTERPAHSAAMDAIEVPFSWLVVGLIPITIGMAVVQYLAFHISLVLGLIAVALSFVVSLVCCRATGETDTTPIGAMGKLTQLLYAALPGAKGVASINLMAAGVTATAGGAAADLLTDLKSGYILGANPRKQFIAQFVGIFFGTVAIVPAWYAMVPTKQALDAFNPPATYMWKAVADLLTQGLHMLPVTAIWAIVMGALVGVALPVAGRLFPKAEPYLPSAMGLGLSWVMVFQNSLSFAIGAVLVAAWKRLNQKGSEHYYVPVASGSDCRGIAHRRSDRHRVHDRRLAGGEVTALPCTRPSCGPHGTLAGASPYNPRWPTRVLTVRLRGSYGGGTACAVPTSLWLVEASRARVARGRQPRGSPGPWQAGGLPCSGAAATPGCT